MLPIRAARWWGMSALEVETSISRYSNSQNTPGEMVLLREDGVGWGRGEIYEDDIVSYVGEVAQLVKHQLYKHENLSAIPSI